MNLLHFVSIIFSVSLCRAQQFLNNDFALPGLSQTAPRVQVDQKYAGYFDLNGPSRQLVDGLVGPRPGIIPPRGFDIQGQNDQANADINTFLNSFAQQAAGAGAGAGGQGAPAGGLDLAALQRQFGGVANQLLSGQSPAVQQTNPNSVVSGSSVSEGGSSIKGIPNIFPDLPKAPVPQQQPRWIDVALGTLRGDDTSIRALENAKPSAPIQLPPILGGQFANPTQFRPQARPQTSQLSSAPQLPQFPTNPQVPQGGLGPLANQFGLSQSQQQFGNAQQQQQPQAQTAGFGSQPGAIDFNQILQGANFNPGATIQGADGGLANTIAQLLQGQGGADQSGLIGSLVSMMIPNSAGANGQNPAQLLGAFQNLLGQSGAAGQGGGVLGDVLYNALTDGAVQTQTVDKDTNTTTAPTNTTQKRVPQFDAEKAAKTIGQNVNLLQQMLQQPNSPLCTPKPQPVSEFNLDAFMGTWYQTLYSPPLAVGPCSMVAYKKLADVASGGPGSVFDTFEYTTEGTAFGKPRISSGYAIVSAPGQLIYRTTSNTNDVNVHVIATGPVNSAGQYEWAAVSVNCNYPLHVFARDPVVYKQKYEAQVNAILAQRGLINGFSRLLNIVSPVDNTLCSFPPTLFNIRG